MGPDDRKIELLAAPPVGGRLASPRPPRQVEAARSVRMPADVLSGESPTFTVDAAGVLCLWCGRSSERGFYRVTESTVTKQPIPEARPTNTWLSPFTDGRLLIWTYHPDPNFPDSAVYAPDGARLAAFNTRDGLGGAQVSPSGLIWWGCDDQAEEGMFDCLSPAGEYLFRYYPFWEQNDLPSICACYAFNVVDDHDVWAYTYPDFPLVYLRDFKLAGRWDASVVPGAHAFAVDGRRVLFAGQYPEYDQRGGLNWDSPRCRLLYLFDLESGEVEPLQPLANGDGDIATPLPVDFARHPCRGRGSRLYLSDGMQIHVFDLAQIV